MSTMSETYMDEVQGDPGILSVLGEQAKGLTYTSEPPEEQYLADVIPFPITHTEEAVLEFNRHPVRDTAFGAIALSGIGFAIGSAVAAHHRHRY